MRACCLLSCWCFGLPLALALGEAELACDPMGQCLTASQSQRYWQAEAHLKLANWRSASQILEELYAEELKTERRGSFLIANNYAVALAETGMPEVAALVLERYFRGLAGSGTGFENLLRAYDRLAGEQGTAAEPLRLVAASTPKAAPPQPDAGLPAGTGSGGESQAQGAAITAAGGGEAAASAESAEPDGSETLDPALQRVLGQRLEDWRSAWAAGDLSGYLACYVADRSPVPALDRARWERQRRERVTADRDIELRLDQVQMQRQARGRVLVEFSQTYTSSHYSDSSRKRLVWVQQAGDWRIESEASH